MPALIATLRIATLNKGAGVPRADSTRVTADSTTYSADRTI